DTRAPQVKISVKRLRADRYELTVRQTANAIEMDRIAPNWRAAAPQVQRRVATIARDVGRVEVRLPSGEILRLREQAPGVFRKVWRLRKPLDRAVRLRVVATDRALNQTAVDATVSP